MACVRRFGGEDEESRVLDAGSGGKSVLVVSARDSLACVESLQEEDAGGNGTVPLVPYTMEDMENFQLFLWVGVALVVVLGFVLYAIMGIDASKDRLLYSQFSMEDGKRD
jgi:hypothetical protein